jgi:hypothetical protein
VSIWIALCVLRCACCAVYNACDARTNCLWRSSQLLILLVPVAFWRSYQLLVRSYQLLMVLVTVASVGVKLPIGAGRLSVRCWAVVLKYAALDG